jgi:hypothetical protein
VIISFGAIYYRKETDDGSSFHQRSSETIIGKVFGGMGINCGKGIIEEDMLSVRVDCSGQSHSRLLTTTERDLSLDQLSCRITVFQDI